METSIPEFLDKVVFDEHAHTNINYVKARCAIEQAFPKRKDRRTAKMAVIEAFKGEIHHSDHNYVLFPDQSKARF